MFDNFQFNGYRLPFRNDISTPSDMIIKKYLIILTILCTFFYQLSADEDNHQYQEDYQEIAQEECSECDECDASPYWYNHGNRFHIGPEIYRAYRSREGGTHQHGWMVGCRIGYDYLRRYTIYVGIDGLYARGDLRGKSGSGSLNASTLTDANIEGRLGYTFQYKDGWRPFFTPFVGGGFYSEVNKFHSPTPLHIHFKTRFSYVTVGFLSGVTITPNWEVGLNAKVRYMLDPKCKITNDPEFENISLGIENDQLQYRIEIPVVYHSSCFEHFALSISPFYEYRYYGKMANYPFDFLKTEFRNWGATFSLVYYL